MIQVLDHAVIQILTVIQVLHHAVIQVLVRMKLLMTAAPYAL